ncbi:MAG: hypothetical protein RBJ76_00770 [Stenomitos frigidus ULC029]
MASISTPLLLAEPLLLQTVLSRVKSSLLLQNLSVVAAPLPPAPMVARSLTAGDTEGKQHQARGFDGS